MKEIISKEELQGPLELGMKKIASIVKRTLGPGGLPILIERVGQQLNGDPLGPKITKDGVSVAVECFDPDPKVDLVIQAVKAICQQTNTKAGDGPQPYWSQVLTPTGFVQFSDLVVGMTICAIDGTTQVVKEIFHKGPMEIYEVVFEGDRVVECSQNHLWTVTTNFGFTRTLPLKDFKDDLIYTSTLGVIGYRYHTPVPRVEGQLLHEPENFPYGIPIKSVRATGKYTDMCCIKVSSPEQLYITDNFIVTHNTTSAVVLGEAILIKALQELQQNPLKNPQMLKLEIEAGANKIKAALKEMSIPVKDKNRISQVATISANGDTSVGDIIGEAFSEVGVEGIITVDEGIGLNTTLEVVDGYQINKGAEARDRFFNAKNNTTFEAMNPIVLVYDGDLNSYSLLAQALEKYAVANNVAGFPPLVLVANDFHPEVIMWLLAQKMEIGLNVVAVKGPHTTYVRTGYYDDLAVLLGAKRLGNGNRSLMEATPQDFGTCEKVVVTRHTTTFYNGAGTEEQVLTQVNHLRELKGAAESPYDAQLIGERLAALTQGIAKIGVGGATEFEIKEKYDRIEDALNAARASIEEGVVPGGGCALLTLANSVFGETDTLTAGEAILKEALRTPFTQILENVGLNPEQIEEIRTLVLTTPDSVYNAKTFKIENFLETGIVDPVKVTRTALENAISIATLLSTSGGGIIILKK